MTRALLALTFIMLAGCAREPGQPRENTPATASTADAPMHSSPINNHGSTDKASAGNASANDALAGNAPTNEAPTGDGPTSDGPKENAPIAPVASGLPPVGPPALPDDRTPISEAPFTPTSAQGAANVVQIYYALLGEHRYDDAWRLWTQGGTGAGCALSATPVR
jgi:hypothetical protein